MDSSNASIRSHQSTSLLIFFKQIFPSTTFQSEKKEHDTVNLVILHSAHIYENSILQHLVCCSFEFNGNFVRIVGHIQRHLYEYYGTAHQFETQTRSVAVCIQAQQQQSFLFILTCSYSHTEPLMNRILIEKSFSFDLL